jgi:Protein of unknown function (DUF726)
VPGLENLDVTSIVNGHMAYRTAMPKLLREVGWEVESDEFAEIEDPDPENHEARQRELIREIDSARQDQEKQVTKGRWNFWSKKGEKKGWETYDVSSAWNWEKEKAKRDKQDPNANVLFDIDAIRRELESEQMEVRQLESTLPPMRLDMNRASTEPNGVPTASRLSTEAPGGSGESPQSPKPANHAHNESRGKWLPFGRRDSKPKTAAAASTSSTGPGHHRRTSSWEEYDETADGQHGSAGEGMKLSFEPKSPPGTMPERRSSMGGHEHEQSSANGWGDASQGGWEPREANPARDWGHEHHKTAGRREDSSPEEPSLDIDHNAWAEDVRSPGAKEGDMKMTFE